MNPTTDRATPRTTPPRWLNWLMSVMLRTPGVQRLVGRQTALVSVVGRRTARIITTPISYTRTNGSVILTAHETRQWWRNLRADPELWLRLAGKERLGTARILRGEDALPYFIAVLEDQPMVARANGLAVDDEGHVDREQAAAVLETSVVVVVDIHPVVASPDG